MATSDTGRDEDAPTIVRSEEELVVSTRAVPIERVRLSKRIVTETVTVTTEVRREELVVERVPVTGNDPDPSAADGDPPSSPRRRDQLLVAARSRLGGAGLTGAPFEPGETEVVLMEEHVEVTKRVVPRERVRLTKHVVTDDRHVTDAVRKEVVLIEQTPTQGATT